MVSRRIRALLCMATAFIALTAFSATALAASPPTSARLLMRSEPVALLTTSPASPGTIAPGGGGFQYSSTKEGYPTGCGQAVIGVNNVGGGKVQRQIEIDSNVGAMAGSAKVTYPGGNKYFDVTGTHYVSPEIEFGNFRAGESVAFVLSFNNITFGSGSGGSCGIPEPEVHFTY